MSDDLPSDLALEADLEDAGRFRVNVQPPAASGDGAGVRKCPEGASSNASSFWKKVLP